MKIQLLCDIHIICRLRQSYVRLHENSWKMALSRMTLFHFQPSSSSSNGDDEPFIITLFTQISAQSLNLQAPFPTLVICNRSRDFKRKPVAFYCVGVLCIWGRSRRRSALCSAHCGGSTNRSRRWRYSPASLWPIGSSNGGNRGGTIWKRPP